MFTRLDEPSPWAIRRRRFLPFAIAMLFLCLAGTGGYGVWWFKNRQPDPVEHAARREKLGDLRETALLRRNEIAAKPNDPDARLRLAEVLLRIGDGVGADGSFRAAERLGSDHWAVLQGLSEAQSLQADWRKLLAEIPDVAPTPQIAARLLLMRATAQIALNRLPAATGTLAAAKRLAPNRIEPLLIAARLSLASGDTKAAEASTAAALALQPGNLDALFLQYRFAQARSDVPAAIAVADHILTIAPWSTTARLDRAAMLMQAGREADASVEVETVLSRAPRVTVALYLRAMLRAREGNDEATVLALEQLGPAIDNFPRALFLNAVLQTKLGKVEAARNLAIRFNKRFPNDRNGVVLLAGNHLASNRADLAIPLLEGAVASAAPGKPVDAEMLALLGSAYTATGNRVGALRTLQDAAVAAPDNARVLASLGMSQLSQGDLTAALASLDRSATLAPPPADLSDAMFDAALRAGDLNVAEAALARRRTQDGDTEAVGTMAALLLLARGDLDQALPVFEALVQNYPDAVVPRVNLSKLLLLRGRSGEAEALLHAILAEDPTSQAALNALVSILLRQNRFDDAIHAAELAEVAAPTNTGFTALRVELLIRQDNPTAALALLEDRRQTKKLDVTLTQGLAQAQAASGDIDAALVTYDAMVKSQPSDTSVRMALVRLLLRQRLFGPAATSLREGIAQTPGVFQIMQAMVSLESSRNGLDAALAMAAELRANPANRPAAGFLQGDLLMQAAKPESAVAAYRAEFEAGPNKSLVLRLAAAESATNKSDAAASTLRQWADIHPNDPDIEFGLSQIDMRTGRWDLAQSDLEARLRKRPNDAQALNNLAWAYQLKGDARALDLAKRSYALFPSPFVADTMGWIMLAQGSIAEAVSVLSQAAAQAPTNPAIAYHLAAALKQSGKRADGIRLLEPFITDPTQFDDRPAAEKLLRELKSAG